MLSWRAQAASGEYLRNLTVPSGLIILLNTTSIPSGWVRFSAADNKHIVGAGSTYAAKSAGGLACAISRESSSAGDHWGGNDRVFARLGSELVYYSGGGEGETAGAHLHTITAVYNRLYQQLVLIKATERHTEFPANGIILSSLGEAPVEGLSICYDDDLILRGGATLATGGGFSSKACSSNGSHIHFPGVRCEQHPGSYQYCPINVFAGAHTHPVTMSLSDEELKRAYLTAWTKTSAFDGAAGIIALWEGVVPPEGWRLCDGNNGTLDLRDYFLILSSAGNAGDQYNESNRISIAASLDSVTNNHTHQGYNVWEYWSTTGPHSSYDNTHSHTSVTAWHNYVPPYYALTFVEKIY